MSDKYTFRILGSDEYENWDSFVDRSPQGTLFHKNEWLSSNGSDYRIFGCYSGSGELVAGFVCGVEKLYDRWTFFTHPKITPYLGNVYSDTGGKYVTQLSHNKKLCYEIANMLKTHCDTINIHLSAYEVDDVMPFVWAGFSVSLRYTYILKLDNMDEVWKNADDRLRNNVKKSRKDGLWIDTECDFNETIILAKKTFQRQGMELGASFIENAIKYEKVMCCLSQCKSFVAKTNEGIPIAALFMVWDKKRSYAIVSGHDFENAHRGALKFAQWASVEYTRNVLGLYEYDFEGTTLIHTERYIREFGGKLIPYYTIRWTHPKLKPFLTAKQFVRDIRRVFQSEVLDGKIID
jgi:hypothetical protein